MEPWEISQDIHTTNQELEKFEAKYGMLGIAQWDLSRGCYADDRTNREIASGKVSLSCS